MCDQVFLAGSDAMVWCCGSVPRFWLIIVDSQRKFQGLVNKFQLLDSSFWDFKDSSLKIQFSSSKFDLEVFFVLVLCEKAIWMYVAI